MALQINDETVIALVDQYQQAIGASSATEAIRHALKHGLRSRQDAHPVAEKFGLNDPAYAVGAIEPVGDFR